MREGGERKGTSEDEMVSMHWSLHSHDALTAPRPTTNITVHNGLLPAVSTTNCECFSKSVAAVKWLRV
jgi:hypothetical protein